MTDASPTPDASRQEVLEGLVCEFVERLGEEGVLEELHARRPDLAAELDERIALLQATGLLGGPAETAAGIPDRLGDFRLIRRLGSGGMGVVYLAEQVSLGREVALKLIRPEHLYFPGARKRFAREVEAIARLRHPGIVPVFAGGEEQRLPYYAMERITGCTVAEALAALADRAPETLTGADLGRVVAGRCERPAQLEAEVFAGGWVEACVRVVIAVAEALEHAHRHGILHRDVKPSNLAITVEGRAMLFDFGVASVSSPDRMTRSGSQIGTLFYMSPEQVRGAKDVDERSDVYSLGVVLYEMLGLQAPYRGEDRAVTEKLILEGRPPSLRARNRLVSSDLETVCFQAMDVEVARRYPGTAAFAKDLRNVLERRPVRARPLGPVGRLRRWTQRNPGPAAAVALGILAGVGTPTALWLQQRAHSERLRIARARAEESAEQHEQVAGFLVDLFRLPDPARSDAAELTAKEILDRGAERLERRLRAVPRTRAGLLRTMGEVYRGIGDYARSRELLERALATVRALPEPDPETVATYAYELAQTLHLLAQEERAEELLREAAGLRRARLGASHWRVAEVEAALAGVLRARQREAEAEELSRHALDVLRRSAAAPPVQVVAALANRASLLISRARLGRTADVRADYEAAHELAREALETAERTGDVDPLQTAALHNTMGLALKSLGRLEDAEAAYRRALAAFRDRLGADDVRIAACLNNLAALVEQQGRLEEASAMLDDVVAALARALPADHRNVVIVRGNRAGLLFRMGAYDRAIEAYREVLPLQEKVFGAGHVYVAYSRLHLGIALLRRGEFEAAEPQLLEAGRRMEALGPRGRGAVRTAARALVELYERTGRPELAKPWREHASPPKDRDR